MGADRAGHQDHKRQPVAGPPRARAGAGKQVLMVAAPPRRRQGPVNLVAAPATIIMCKELWEAYLWHRIAALNGIAGDAK